jgi:hypothetical protein
MESDGVGTRMGSFAITGMMEAPLQGCVHGPRHGARRAGPDLRVSVPRLRRGGGKRSAPAGPPPRLTRRGAAQRKAGERRRCRPPVHGDALPRGTGWALLRPGFVCASRAMARMRPRLSEGLTAALIASCVTALIASWV